MSEDGPLFFCFDYVDPVSYFLERELREKEEGGAPSARRAPLELRPPTGPLLDPDGPEFVGRWKTGAALWAGRGVALKKPWIVPWTRKAHELGFFAREQGSFEEIHEALFRAYLIEGRDIGRIDVLVDLARTVGMDPMETKAVLDVDRFRKRVEEAQAHCFEAGCTAPPAFSLGKRKIEGDPDPEALRRFLTSWTG